jgi:hypothetical protein
MVIKSSWLAVRVCFPTAPGSGIEWVINRPKIKVGSDTSYPIIWNPHFFHLPLIGSFFSAFDNG